MSSHALLSVIIPTLNEVEHLPELLYDLKLQRNIALEIIIGDGGSTDGTFAVAEQFGVTFVSCKRGRGAQMNAAARKTKGDFILFLHADSRIDHSHLLTNSLKALLTEQHNSLSRIAGHFRLRFIRSTLQNATAYRYAEGKTAFNRVNTTNGDQGLLLSRVFFQELGGFDETLPFLEDQRIAEKIRAQGKWLTLPGYLKTSARRFEAEGFHRRYILMSIMMGLHSVGAEDFFARAPAVYRTQQETGKLFLSPFFALIWRMTVDDWGLWGSIRVFYLLGEYIRQNSWQMFYFIDTTFCPQRADDHYLFLDFHDRFFAPCTNFRIINVLVGLCCFIWFMVILAPFFWILDQKGLKLGKYLS